MRIDGRFAWLGVALAVLAVTAASGAAAAPFGLAVGTTQVEVDDIYLAIELQPDGDAVWTVEHRSRLDTVDRRDAFEAQMQDIQADPEAYTADLEGQLGETAAAAAQATGRPMQVVNVSIHAEIQQLPREYGVITYAFEWTGFAAVSGDELRAGGVLSGLFLDADTRLRIEWPASYRLVEVRPTPDETREFSVTWVGPTNFGSGEPDLVVSRSTNPLDAAGVPALWVGLGALAVAAAGGFAYRRYRGRPRPTGGSWEDDPEPAGEPSGPPLLANDERVIELLEANGGRVKQQQIVAELGWSETKTSDVVAEMHEAGTIERFRLGRENIISLPGEDPRI